MQTAPNLYSALATAVLFLHALFIVWVVFGAVVTRSRPIRRWLHIVSLIWGILTELLPWPWPLTLLENWLEQKGGVAPYRGASCFTLSGQTGLSRHFCNGFDSGRSARLHLQPSDLW